VALDRAQLESLLRQATAQQRPAPPCSTPSSKAATRSWGTRQAPVPVSKAVSWASRVVAGPGNAPEVMCEEAVELPATPVTPERVEGKNNAWGVRKAWAVPHVLAVGSTPLHTPLLKLSDYPELPQVTLRPGAGLEKVAVALPPSRRSLSGGRTSSEGGDACKTSGRRQLNAKKVEQRLMVERLRAEIAQGMKKNGRTMATFSLTTPARSPPHVYSRRDSGRGVSDA